MPKIQNLYFSKNGSKIQGMLKNSKIVLHFSGNFKGLSNGIICLFLQFLWFQNCSRLLNYRKKTNEHHCILSHCKAFISGNLDPKGLRCGSTFILCQSLMKKDILLHIGTYHANIKLHRMSLDSAVSNRAVPFLVWVQNRTKLSKFLSIGKPPQSVPQQSADPTSLRLALCYTPFSPIYYIQ